MIHFAYLAAFAFFVSVAFGAMSTGSSMERIRYGIKTFLQFMIVSLVLAWILYFIPWN
jgi:hypothetical protein